MRTASLFRSGEQSNQVDPFSNAIMLAQQAERRARKNRNVSDMLAASTQWLAIAQIHHEMTSNSPPKGQVGFTGGNNE